MPSRLVRALAFFGTLLLVVATGQSAAYAGDSPNGFWWGTDDDGPPPSSSASPCPSSSSPWLEPNTSNGGCGHYGFYGGNVASWYALRGCTYSQHWNATAATRARSTNTYYSGTTPGAVAYYYGGGPGADPNYISNSTSAENTEAYAWGKKQADAAIQAAASHSFSTHLMVYDVEDPRSVDGWNEVLSACHTMKSSYINPSFDRQTFNGFWDEIWNHSSFWIAVYSSPGTWSGIFGTGAYSVLSNTMEITGDWGPTNCATPAPHGWTSGCASYSATFFAGKTSSSDCALGWQWSGSSGDYDQIDDNRILQCK